MRSLHLALRILSIGGIVAASIGFLVVALVAGLSETVTAIILFVCLIEIVRSYLVLRYLKRANMEIRRRELEMYQPTQWYSDRR